MSIAPVSPAAIELAAKNPILTVKGITEDVFVKGLHSHNDYWRDIPLFSSLLKGVQSVEADIWAFAEDFTQTKTDITSTGEKTTVTQDFNTSTIYVSHDLNYMNNTWTLSNLYLDPIFNLLQDANPKYTSDVASGQETHGVWYGASGSTLYLFLDTKKDANTTYNAIKPLLQPFIDNGFLTYYNETGNKWEEGPLTIVLTGNLPTELVYGEETRYVSLDGKLENFNESATVEDLEEIAKYSIIASASFAKLFGSHENMQKNQFNETEKAILSEHIRVAHKYGVKTRIWEHTNYPGYLRDGQNTDLIALGSDLLNMDLLEEVCDQF